MKKALFIFLGIIILATIVNAVTPPKLFEFSGFVNDSTNELYIYDLGYQNPFSNNLVTSSDFPNSPLQLIYHTYGNAYNPGNYTFGFDNKTLPFFYAVISIPEEADRVWIYYNGVLIREIDMSELADTTFSLENLNVNYQDNSYNLSWDLISDNPERIRYYVYAGFYPDSTEWLPVSFTISNSSFYFKSEDFLFWETPNINKIKFKIEAVQDNGEEHSLTTNYFDFSPLIYDESAPMFSWNFDNNLEDNSSNIIASCQEPNCPLFVDGYKNQALEFDGIDDYLRIKDIMDFDASYLRTFTISTWIKIPDMNSWGAIISQHPIQINFNRSLLLYVSQSVYSKGIRFILSDDGFNMIPIDSDEGIQINEWVNVVVRYNGTDEEMFINGIKQNSTRNVSSVFDSNLDILIGASQLNDNSNEVTWNFKGLVDELTIWNRALTDEEIQGIKNSGQTSQQGGILTAFVTMISKHKRADVNSGRKIAIEDYYTAKNNLPQNIESIFGGGRRSRLG